MRGLLPACCMAVALVASSSLAAPPTVASADLPQLPASPPPPAPPPPAAAAPMPGPGPAPPPAPSPAPESAPSANVVVLQAPTLATHEAPVLDGASAPHGRKFYESGWFWGAVGAAALVGGAIFLATQDTSSPTIHLQVQVPH
jgi:hypothetical protein